MRADPRRFGQATDYSMRGQTFGLVMQATLTWPQQGSDLAECSPGIQMGYFGAGDQAPSPPTL